MRLEFYYDSQKSDIEKVSNLIRIFKNLKKKNIQVKITDVSGMSKEEIFEIYKSAWRPSICKKYKVRRVFGTHRQAGILFGKNPALLVYKGDGEHPTDVYPHDIQGKEIRIDDFISKIK